MLPIFTHIYCKGEHVGIIEQMIIVIKDHARCMCHEIPYQYYTKIIIQSFISCVVTWFDTFPTRGVLSKTTVPSMIVKGKPNTDFNQERIVFLSYSLFYIGTSNNINRRSMPYIALNEPNNHEVHYFVILYTVKILLSYDCTELHIDDGFI